MAARCSNASRQGHGASHRSMSALGHSRPSWPKPTPYLSAVTPIRTNSGGGWIVREVPKADNSLYPLSAALATLRLSASAEVLRSSAVGHVRYGPKADIAATAAIQPAARSALPGRQGRQSIRCPRVGHSACRPVLSTQKWRLPFHQIARALAKIVGFRSPDDLEQRLVVPHFHAIQVLGKGPHTTIALLFCQLNATRLRISRHWWRVREIRAPLSKLALGPVVYWAL